MKQWLGTPSVHIYHLITHFASQQIAKLQLSRDPLDHHAPFRTLFGPWLAAIRNEEKSQRVPALQDAHLYVDRRQLLGSALR